MSGKNYLIYAGTMIVLCGLFIAGLESHLIPTFKSDALSGIEGILMGCLAIAIAVAVIWRRES